MRTQLDLRNGAETGQQCCVGAGWYFMVGHTIKWCSLALDWPAWSAMEAAQLGRPREIDKGKKSTYYAKIALLMM